MNNYIIWPQINSDLFIYYIFDFFLFVLLYNVTFFLMQEKSPYVFVIEELHSLCRHQYYILWFLLTEKPCSSSPFPSLSPVAANSHPEAQEGASIDEPLRRSDRTGSGREGSLLPRLQSSSSRRSSGEWRPVETSVEDLTFEPWSLDPAYSILPTHFPTTTSCSSRSSFSMNGMTLNGKGGSCSAFPQRFWFLVLSLLCPRRTRPFSMFLFQLFPEGKWCGRLSEVINRLNGSLAHLTYTYTHQHGFEEGGSIPMITLFFISRFSQVPKKYLILN